MVGEGEEDALGGLVCARVYARNKVRCEAVFCGEAEDEGLSFCGEDEGKCAVRGEQAFAASEQFGEGERVSMARGGARGVGVLEAVYEIGRIGDDELEGRSCGAVSEVLQ